MFSNISCIFSDMFPKHVAKITETHPTIHSPITVFGGLCPWPWPSAIRKSLQEGEKGQYLKFQMGFVGFLFSPCHFFTKTIYIYIYNYIFCFVENMFLGFSAQSHAESYGNSVRKIMSRPET